MKQSFWDRPGVQLDRSNVETILIDSFQRAASRHSGDWLMTS